MSNTTGKGAEDGLEKQYEDYRAQFEQWKENNKSSIGTDAYNSYVAQFEQWEREVEARKNSQKQQHRKVAVDEKEAEAAAAYAQSQEAYVSHHLKAMEQAEMQQRAAAAAAAAAQQQHFMQSQQVRRGAGDIVIPDMFMRDMMSGTSGYQQTQTHAAPPNLWGNPKPTYDFKDPLYAKWGDRAATTHTKPVTDKPVNPVACWMLLDTLREKKMVLAPHSSSVPPPPVQGLPM